MRIPTRLALGDNHGADNAAHQHQDIASDDDDYGVLLRTADRAKLIEHQGSRSDPILGSRRCYFKRNPHHSDGNATADVPEPECCREDNRIHEQAKKTIHAHMNIWLF